MSLWCLAGQPCATSITPGDYQADDLPWEADEAGGSLRPSIPPMFENV